MTSFGFVMNISVLLRQNRLKMKATLWSAKGCCPAGPAFGAALHHTFVTYRLTFMAQHALVDFLGQDQVARLRSGPDFVALQLSLCAPGWAWRGEPNRNVLCSVRENKIKKALCSLFVKIVLGEYLHCSKVQHLQNADNIFKVGICSLCKNQSATLLTTAHQHIFFIVHGCVLFGLH